MNRSLTSLQKSALNLFTQNEQGAGSFGGRITKCKGKAASMSPMIGQLFGTTSLVTVALMTVTPAAAQSICTETGAGTNVYNCSGTSTDQQDLTDNGAATVLDVNLDSTVMVSASGNSGAFNLRSDNGIDFVQAANGGPITGRYDGISVSNNASGDLSITTTGKIEGETRDGIQAVNYGGKITIVAAETIGRASGISGYNYGSGALSITTTDDITGGIPGAGTSGINARNYGRDATIDAQGDTTGFVNGIYAMQGGSGALSITTIGEVEGLTGDGIDAYNSGTSLTINAQGNVEGGNNGIRAKNYGSAGLTITAGGDVTASPDGSGDGIDAYNSVYDTTASMTINQSAGTTTTGANGIEANNSGGSLTINALGSVIGQDGDGIKAYNGPGATDLAITSNLSAGSENGIRAQNTGTGATSVNSTGIVAGYDGAGISANGYGTDLTVNAADTYGSQRGIFTNNYGSGALTITSTGTTTGRTRGGIYASNAGTSVTIDAVNVSGYNNGIYSFNVGSGLTTISTSGTVGATSYGSAIRSVTTRDTGTIINNSGTLNIQSLAPTISTNGGNTTINNTATGTINGGVQLRSNQQFSNIVNNAGTFNVTTDSDFFSANSTFNNTGTLRNVAGTQNFNDLDQLNNSGTITLANGAANEELVTAGDFTGSGNGNVSLDVDFEGAGISDKLLIGGAATGGNTITITDVTNGAANFGRDILLVDAGTGTSATAFTLMGQPTSGFLSYDLNFDAGNNDFFLSSSIGAPAFRVLKFAEGAQSLWHRSADAWAAQMASRRVDGSAGLWVQLYGAKSDRNDSRSFMSNAFSTQVATDYEQDYLGVQTGYDFGGSENGRGIIFGVTGGYQQSDLNFDRSRDEVEYQTFNVGGYVGYNAGGFYTNLLAKYDFIDADVNAPDPGYTAELDGSAYGALLEAGYMAKAGNYFIEPSASIEYTKTRLDDFSAFNADIDIDKFDGLRGMAGLRIGGEHTDADGEGLTYYVGADVVHEFKGDDGLIFSAGTSFVRINNQELGTFGRLQSGITLSGAAGFSGFAEANIDTGRGYESYGGRLGIKFAF